MNYDIPDLVVIRDFSNGLEEYLTSIVLRSFVPQRDFTTIDDCKLSSG